MEEKAKVLEVKDLSVSYTVANVKTHILEDVSFAVSKGKSVGIVGESGCGKTTTMRAILNVLPSNGNVEKGEILYCGEDVLKMSNAKLQEYRQKGAGMIFQDPSSALNPVISIKNQFLEALKYAHKDKKLTKAQLLEKAGKSLEAVSLADPERILNSYPFQLSVPVIRRNEAASVHCHDLGCGAPAAACGRAGNRVGRDDTGSDSQADQTAGGFRGTVGYHGDAFSWGHTPGYDGSQYYVCRHDGRRRGHQKGI